MPSEIYTLELPRLDYNIELEHNTSGHASVLFDKNGLSYIHRLPAKAYEDAISATCNSANSYRFGDKEFKGIPILLGEHHPYRECIGFVKRINKGTVTADMFYNEDWFDKNTKTIEKMIRFCFVQLGHAGDPIMCLYAYMKLLGWDD